MRNFFVFFIAFFSASCLFGQEMLQPAIVQKAVYFDVSPPLSQMMSRDSARADRTWVNG